MIYIISDSYTLLHHFKIECTRVQNKYKESGNKLHHIVV